MAQTYQESTKLFSKKRKRDNHIRYFYGEKPGLVNWADGFGGSLTCTCEEPSVCDHIRSAAHFLSQRNDDDMFLGD